MTTAAQKPLFGSANLARPRAGSWLDLKAKRVAELLAERHGLAGFDPDSAYLAFAEDLRLRRDNVAMAMHITPGSAQQYIDEEILMHMADSVAASLADEKPGSGVFDDDDTVPVELSVWVRAMWSLQLAAVAAKSKNEQYAWSLVEAATSMSMVLSRAAEDGATDPIAAPRAGVAYVARILAGASEQIAVWGCTAGDLTSDQLTEGLDLDSMNLRALL